MARIYKSKFGELEKFWIYDRPEDGDAAKTTITFPMVENYNLDIYPASEHSVDRVHTEEDSSIVEGVAGTGSGLRMFSALQTDWGGDSLGYTARLEIDPTAWSVAAAEGGNDYILRLQYNLNGPEDASNPTTADVVITRYRLTCLSDKTFP